MGDIVYIGIDNGPSGSVGIIKFSDGHRVNEYHKIPIRMEQDYTKKKGSVTRIDHKALSLLISEAISDARTSDVLVLLERPMKCPMRFRATVSAMRALESVLIVIENLGLRKEYIDSREWQKVLLPEGTKGTSDLKKASTDIGSRFFPELQMEIESRGDADGILLAEYAVRRDSRQRS